MIVSTPRGTSYPSKTFHVPDGIRNIVTTVVTGGVSMVIIFAIDKTIFAEGFGKKKEKA